MCKFDRGLAAIDRSEQGDDVAQLHARITRSGETARIELRVHVGLGEAQVIELENARDTPLHQSQGIEIRNLVPAQAVDLEHAAPSVPGDRDPQPGARAGCRPG
jgi:hypothetical protein